MWQAQGFGVLQKQSCCLLAVFCGKGFDRKTYETKNDGPIYPFPELVSAGRLEVRCLNNPSIDEYKQALESLEPDFVYLQGARCANEKEEIGSLVWGDVDLSTAEAITGLFGSKLPNTVYLEVPNGEKLAEALRVKGIPYVIYWKNAFSSYAACHFCQALISVLQSSSSQTWDAFQLAYASFRLYCVRNNHVLPVNGQKASAKHGPHLLGDPPKVVMKEVAEDLEGEEGSPSELPAIKIYDDEVTTRFLVCGLPCILDACLLGYLEDGLNALLNIEIRGSKLHNRVSATPPPLAAGTFSRGVVTMRCDLSTCSNAHLSLLLSGSAQTCFDDQLLESHIKNELVERSQLVYSAPGCEEPKPSSCEPRRSISVACGASVFEVCMKVPAWASQVLRQLAPDVSYRSLVTLGIASVQGLAVASFEIDDAARLVFFCSKQSMTNLVNSPEIPPEWFRPPVPCRSRLSSSHVTRSPANGSPNSCAVASTSKPEHGIDAKMETELTDSKPVVPCNQGFKVPAMRPIPHTRKHKLMPFSGVSDVEPYEGSHGKISTTSLPPLKPNYVPPAPPTYRKSSSNSFPSQPVIPLNPLPLKKHGCSRSPIQECPEEEFLRDVMQFLLLRGHNRLVPPGGLCEFPEAILNAKRLDLYNLYREVVSRGGFNVGNGINWKGQVFSKMRNHTTTNRMTGVGNTLKRHYETYLLEYELAHDDVAGECCLLCQSSEAGDWVNCSICDEWAHFGCDRRQGLGTFKDYSKTHGRDYICPRCSLSSYRGQPGRKSQKNCKWLFKSTCSIVLNSVFSSCRISRWRVASWLLRFLVV